MVDDGLPDNRITCDTCRNASGSMCARLRVSIIKKLPLRCLTYSPRASESDQRLGTERWPGFAQELAAARTR